MLNRIHRFLSGLMQPIDIEIKPPRTIVDVLDDTAPQKDQSAPARHALHLAFPHVAGSLAQVDTGVSATVAPRWGRSGVGRRCPVMGYTPPPDRPTVVVLTAGSDAYVFDEGDGLIEAKVKALVEAKLNVGQAKIDAVEWAFVVRSALDAKGVNIIDCRKNAVE